MIATLESAPTTYLKEGTIDASNIHLFSPDVRETFLFFQQYEDKPINSAKHAEAVWTVFWWKWKPKIIEKKRSNPNLPFKTLIAEMLDYAPSEWDADQVVELIVRTKKVWQAPDTIAAPPES